MPVDVSIFLFGKPGEMIDEGSEVTGEELRDLGVQLGSTLQEIGRWVDRLQADGWSAEMRLYDLVLSHPDVDTAEEAHERLKAAGIREDAYHVEEFEEDAVAQDGEE